MDFVKIKENIFVIIIGVLFVGALAAAIVSFTNKQQGAEVVGNTQGEIINAFSKSVGTDYMKNNTIQKSFAKALNGKSLDGKTIDPTDVYFAANSSGGAVEAEDGTAIFTGNVPYTGDDKLVPILVPQITVTDSGGNKATSSYVITSGSVKIGDTTRTDLENLTPAQKGFVTNGYFGFGTFASKADAEDFQDKYMPNSYIITTDGSHWAVVMPIAQ